jgi:hypothetical protein
VFVLDYLFRNHVIDERAFVAACLAYVWGLFSMLLCGWFWQRQIWTNWLADDSIYLNEVRLKLASDGIECSDQTKLTKYSWRAFSDISEYDNFVVLWFDRTQGILVPARTLANQETRQHFVSLVREHVAPPELGESNLGSGSNGCERKPPFEARCYEEVQVATCRFGQLQGRQCDRLRSRDQVGERPSPIPLGYRALVLREL